MDRHAVDRFQQRHLDEIMLLDEAADRQRRRDHQQRIAGVRIDEPVQQAGPRQRHRDIGQRGIGDIADHHQRLLRRLHRIGEGEHPVRAALVVAGQRRHLRPVETNADRLTLVQRQPADVGDQRPAPAADRLDIDRLQGIEHQPHRVGAAKQGRGRRRGKRERHAQGVAVPPGGDRCGRPRRPAAASGRPAATPEICRRRRGDCAGGGWLRHWLAAPGPASARWFPAPARLRPAPVSAGLRPRRPAPALAPP